MAILRVRRGVTEDTVVLVLEFWAGEGCGELNLYWFRFVRIVCLRYPGFFLGKDFLMILWLFIFGRVFCDLDSSLLEVSEI